VVMMNHAQRHIIGRITLELETADTADTWSVQSELSELLQNAASAEIEQLFNQRVAETNVVRLEQLSVELPPFTPDQLSSEFVPCLIAALSEALDHQFGVLATVEGALGATSTGTADAFIASVSGSEWECFIYFLTYGRFPWWQESLPFLTWIARWEAVLTEDAIAWRQPLKQCLFNSIQSRERFVYQLPASFCHQLIAKLQPNWAQWPSLIEEARSLTQQLNTSHNISPLSDNTLHYLEQHAWLVMLAQISPSTTTSTPFFVQSWLKSWLGVVVDCCETSERSHIINTLQDTITASYSSQWLAAINDIRLQAAPTSQDAIETSKIPENILPISEKPFSSDSQLQKGADNDAEIAASSEHSLPAVHEDTVDETIETELPHKGQEEKLSRDSDSLNIGDNIVAVEPQSADLSDTSPPLSPDESSQREPSIKESVSEDLSDNRLSLYTLNQQAMAGDLQTASDEQQIVSDSSQMQETTPDFSQLPLHPLAYKAPRQNGAEVLSSDESANGIYLNHAGLVILHPFLQIYFEDVGLLTENSFSNEYAQQQAIALLHYFSTGQTTRSEPELILPKLLCSWPLNDPLNSNIQLPPSALTEAENLLSTVITYWDALKTTTPTGLREGFLQRSGKLTYTNGWNLQVEQQAVDILLSRLPWGIGMVKLPWMTDFLTVEWT